MGKGREGYEAEEGKGSGVREENGIGEEVERRLCKNLETNHLREIG